MGNRNSGKKPIQKITEEELEEAVLSIVKNQAAYFTQDQLKAPIRKIIFYLRQNHLFDSSSEFLRTSPSLIRLFFCHNFPYQMMKVLKLLLECLENINQRSLTFLKVSQISNLTLIANFIVFVSNQKITSTFDSMLVRSDIDPANKEMIKKIQGQNEEELDVIGNLMEKMPEEEKEGIQKLLRVTLISFINLRNKPLGRSEETLRFFSMFEASLFMLYTQMHFSKYSPEMHTPIQKQSFKSNIIIGAYFLSAGTSFIKPSIYETAVIFLYSVLKLPGIQHSQIKSLPSHYFKNLPVVTSISIYESILCYTLFTLKHIHKENSYYMRFGFNRIVSMKFVLLLLEDIKGQNDLITFYLEELCIQVKAGQIERACLYEIVKNYVKKSDKKSQIFSKFLQNGNLKYNLKFANKEIKVNPVEVMTELEDEKDTSVKQYLLLSQKYLYQKVFMRNLAYNLNDRSLWSQILPGILNNKQDQQIQIMSKMQGQFNQSSGGEEEMKKSGMSEEKEQFEIQNQKNVDVQTEQKLH